MTQFYDWPLRYLIWGLVRDHMPENMRLREAHDIGEKISDAIEAAPVQDTRYRSLKRSYKNLGKQYGAQSQRLGASYAANALLRERLKDVQEHGGTYRRLREAEARIAELEAEASTPKRWPETHTKGKLSIENPDLIAEMLHDNGEIDFGTQISYDGRVWVCINGIAWLRFKPTRKSVVDLLGWVDDSQ